MSSAPLDARERTPIFANIARLFGSVDLRSLALLRIALGLVLCADLIARLRLVDTLYSNEGVLSNHFSLFRPLAPFQFSLYAAASSTRDVTFVFWLTLLVYLLFTVGYRTRLFQVISFICVTSLHTRNLLAELPSDVPLHLLMAWSLVMPLGARFSVDSVRKSLRREPDNSPDELNRRPGAPAPFTSLAAFGMIAQIAIMHIAPAVRQDGAAWRDGTALYYALRQNLWVTDLGTWFAEQASPGLTSALTTGFRAMEFAIGALVLLPTWYARRLAAALLLVFHVTSRLLWDMGPYEWVMLAGIPILLTPRDWDAFVRWYQRRKPALTAYFDADCGVCFALCRLLRRLDPLAKITFAPNASETAPAEVKAAAQETIVVRDEKSGKTFTKSRALASIVSSLPLGLPFGLLLRVPGVSHVADFAYDKVAKNRTAISVWFGYDACGVGEKSDGPAVAPDAPIPELASVLAISRETAATLFFVVCGLALTFRMNDETKPQGPLAGVYSIVAYPRLFQDWKLFAPEPSRRQGAFVVDAQTGKGVRIDPLTGRPPLEMLDPKKPDPRSRPSPLLGAYFANINQSSRLLYVDELKNYLQRLGDQRESGDKLVWFNVNWIEAAIPPPGGGVVAPAETEVIPARRITSRP